jgi:hypothetical protein
MLVFISAERASEFETLRNGGIEGFSHASHRIFEKSAGTICLALPHGRDE